MLSLGLTVHAQGLPTTIGGLELTPSTQNPVPGQTVTIKARSFSTNIDSANITWKINGKVEKSGIGATDLEVSAPALGKKLNIIVSAVTNSGTITNSIVIGSGAVDMIVETDGYVPPLFKGKIPVVYQNNIKIVAIPHIADSAGAEYDPKTLVYQWKKNDTVLESQSGYGKQSVVIAGDPVPRPFDVTVTVSNRANNAGAMGIISIGYQTPFIGLYVDDPLYGPLFNVAIGNSLNIGSQKETGVISVPFGFNISDRNLSNLTLTWLINNNQYPELDAHQSIVLRAPNNTSGTSNVNLTIQNNEQILQGGQRGFSAVFSETQTSSQTESVNF